MFPHVTRRPTTGFGFLLALSLSACSSGGSSSTPIGGSNVPPELLACRARIDSPTSFAEVALRTARNLGSSRVADRSGSEHDARVHPDGNTVVLSRERPDGDADSAELHLTSLDGSFAELRLTQNNRRDGEPCWSPDGSTILFTSERDGVPMLWKMAADGSDAQRFLSPPAGESDGAPDWCRATGRVVFSRRDAHGKHRLHLCSGTGTNVIPLTDGGLGSGAGDGDHAPSFSPDGAIVAFVRRLGTNGAALCLTDIASSVVTPRLAISGQLDLPRFSPSADRLFFGIAEPTAGRGTLRLATIGVASGDPTLLWPDERWRLQGIDLLPVVPAAPTGAQSRVLDIEKAQVQLAFGNGLSGSKSQLAAVDGAELRVGTAPNDNHQVAGINCRFDLPVVLPEDVVELRIRAVARVLRTGGDTALRMSIYNPVDERFDTAVEMQPLDTNAVTMTFRTTSLRHVTRERQLRLTVIGDVANGAATELLVDLVEVELLGNLTPP